MRRAFWALMVCAAASTTGALPAAARDYPFCIKGCDFGAGRGDCSFSSLQECQATASGRGAYCAEKILTSTPRRNCSLIAAANPQRGTDA
jgi:hypothetical protein